MLGTAVGGRWISSFSRVARDIFDLRNWTSLGESRDISVIFAKRWSISRLGKRNVYSELSVKNS